MEQFAGYGFNKSHSAAYAYLAYVTAYLKAHYPVDFMAALLTSETGNTAKVVKYINECREMGIQVSAAGCELVGLNFSPDGDGIRFGLCAIRNVGEAAVESMISARASGPFTSLFDFCEDDAPPGAPWTGTVLLFEAGGETVERRLQNRVRSRVMLAGEFPQRVPSAGSDLSPAGDSEAVLDNPPPHAGERRRPVSQPRRWRQNRAERPFSAVGIEFRRNDCIDEAKLLGPFRRKASSLASSPERVFQSDAVRGELRPSPAFENSQ